MIRLKIGKGRSRLVGRFPGRRHWNLCVALDQAGQVPAAQVVTHQVDTGLGGAGGGDLDPSAEKGTEPYGCGNFLRADHWFSAEGGIVVDDEPFKIETRSRQKAQADVVELYAAAECTSDGAGDTVSQVAPTGPEQKEDQQRSRNRSDYTPRAENARS